MRIKIGHVAFIFLIVEFKILLNKAKLLLLFATYFLYYLAQTMVITAAINDLSPFFNDSYALKMKKCSLFHKIILLLHF